MSSIGLIDFRFDEAAIAEVEQILSDIKNGAPRALTKALNDTANHARTQIAKQGAAEINMTQARLKGELFGPGQLSTNKATFGNQVARVTARARGFRMMNFVTNYTDATAPLGKPPKVIKTKVKKGGPTIEWPGAYFLELKNTGGLRGVFVKSEHKYGPSPSQIFSTLKPVLSPALAVFMAEELDREIKTVIRRFG